MAHRHLLLDSRINEFAKCLVDQGWKIQDPKGDYEALRATHREHPAIVIFWRRQKHSRARKAYCTIRDGCPSLPLVRKWLKESPSADGEPRDRDMEPDWTGKCEVCGQSPIVKETGMCGPCTFGEAETVGGNW